jgi:NADH-quinone oxidoreductase subunit L
MWMPAWIEGVRIRLYVLFMNRLYADELYQLLGQATMRLIHLIDKRDQGWSR